MSRKGEMKRLGLTLFMDSPLHREAWTILSALPARQRTEAICLALCRERERDAILETVRRAVREEWKGVQPKQKSNDKAERAADVGDNVRDFLRSLQKDGGGML